MSATQPSVALCRDCCCGTFSKHPDTDHDMQLLRLRRTVNRVMITDCLDACENSNVVVVRPSQQGRKRGGRAIWFGGLLEPHQDELLCAWIEAGGPGIAPIPPELARLRVKPPSDGKR